MADQCPDATILESLLLGRLGESQQSQLERHIEDCTQCRNRLEALADVQSVLPKTSPPSGFQAAANSPRLGEVIEQLRAQGPLSATVIAASQTHVVPMGDASLSRAGLWQRPRRIGDYQIEVVLGQGGIGVVYRGTDPQLNRDVAIKILRPAFADDASMRERFLREARTAASLRNDHVVAIYGVGLQAEQPYLIMEYVAGGSLADRLKRKGKLACDEVVRLGIEVASGLAAAHAKGFIHRDVKPGNILWDVETARYKLTDFGLAKALDDVGLTQTGAVAGTPEYLSPEQAEGASTDARSDLFSLGTVLYTAASGESPFHADSSLAAVHKVRTYAPQDLTKVRADCPPELAKLVGCLLAKDPKNRYQSASEVVEELSRIEQQHFGSRGSAVQRASLRRRRRLAPRGAAAVAVAFVALAAIIWYATSEREPAPSGTDQAIAAGSPSQVTTHPQKGFTIQGNDAVFQSLAEAVAAAPADATIEVHGSGRLPMAPMSIRNKPLIIRAAAGSRFILAPIGGADANGAAIETDSDLQLIGLHIQWSAVVAPSQFPDTGPRDNCAVASSGGTLQLDHCEIDVGKATGCVAVDGAACEIRNSRLTSGQGVCVFWRPVGGSKLVCENSVFVGRCCIRSVGVAFNENSRPDLLASLELNRNTWQGQKGLELMFGLAPRRQLQVRATHNMFGIEHLLTMFWVPRGRRSYTAPDIDRLEEQLPNFLRWQEQENIYPANLSFLSAQSPNQSLKMVKGAPTDIAAWDAFWNRPASGSLQGAAAEKLRDKAGADEQQVGPVPR